MLELDFADSILVCANAALRPFGFIWGGRGGCLDFLVHLFSAYRGGGGTVCNIENVEPGVMLHRGGGGTEIYFYRGM